MEDITVYLKNPKQKGLGYISIHLPGSLWLLIIDRNISATAAYSG